MGVRTRRHKVTFNNPFMLEAASRKLPAGTYEVVTDEELIEGLSCPPYRRVATMMIAPGPTSSSTTEMLTVDPSDLTVALARDGPADVDAAARAR
jgi:hypothetical protein